LASGVVGMLHKKLCCITEHVEPGKCWPLDKVGKATELGTKISSFGVTGAFLPPFKTTNVDFF